MKKAGLTVPAFSTTLHSGGLKMYCGEGTLVKYGGPEARAVTLFCRSWGCDTCNPRRRAQLKALAMAGAPRRFVTLTMRQGQHETPDAQALALTRCWRLIVKRWRRANKGELEYLAVFEAHPASGWPHLHVLVRGGWISQKWLSDAMKELEDSPVQDVRAVKGRRGAAAYISKYIGKAPGKFGHAKRYWHSKRWELVKRERPDRGDCFAGTWTRSSRDIWRWAATLESFGYLCWFPRRGKLIGWREYEIDAAGRKRPKPWTLPP